MRLHLTVSVLAACLLSAQTVKDDWQKEFSVDKKNLGVKGSNPYFNLTPGYILFYTHGKDTDTLTVLSDTKMIDGVETRVVEDREMKNGKLAELTRDYYAIDSQTGDVYYFGEDVDAYKDGKVIGHEGSWLSGVKGAKFGLMMPAKPKVGQKFYQELAPGVGMDRVEIVSDHDRLVTPAGTFENCVQAAETSPIEKGLKDHKWYAAGIGQVKDAEWVLVKYGMK
jgi:hypothetical protein